MDGVPNATHAPHTVDRPLDGLDILIVEDNTDASEMLTVVLSDGGARLRLAPDYDSAMAELGVCWPDVLVSDIGLPGRDGYELIRAVRALDAGRGGSRLVAVAFTAFSRPEDKVRATEAGFDAHLGKPLQPHVLMKLVLQLVTRAKALD